MRFFALGLFVAMISPLQGNEPVSTGPATEKRFPPLKLPAGFKATLFACDPFIEYPSVICNGPKTGSLFVGVDYMTGLGTDGVVKSEIRLIEDTDGDGYADKSTVYAKGFNSIQGLAYHNGTVYVMHAPFLTALRDTKGTGVADERKDLLVGLGLTPEENPLRLHCANGVVVGHDGWLYLALGDHGCDVKRPEGDRLVLHGGGILRCRPDGKDLHVFASGLRNIYDVALDEDLNVFVRDNENDGGTYMNRVYHSFFGADHGYPYLYEERPAEAMPPLADLGLGSSAGGVCYLETQFPAEYRGNLFFCEWGRAVMRYRPERSRSGFGPLNEIEFAAGAENDPYGFKPTDLVVDRDGALFVSDWADGQRPKRGRGRIYRITYVGDKNSPPKAESKEPADGLNSDSSYKRIAAQERIEHDWDKLADAILALHKGHALDVREGLHLVWISARAGGPKAIDQLFEIASSDQNTRVHAQVVRALADLTDPVLVKHRLDAGPGDAKMAQRLSEIKFGGRGGGRDFNERVLLEVVIALGRLRWVDSPGWLQQHLNKPDPALAHAAMMTLRKCGNWPAVLKLIDLPASEPIRAIALRATADQYVSEVVDGLIERLRIEKDPARRREYADALTRVHKKPGPWSYWGYRPPPRPANSVSWERTEAIEQALDSAVRDPDKPVRLAVLRRMQREKIPARLAALVQWLREETQGEALQVILDSLRELPAASIREPLAAFISDNKKPAASRLIALSLLAGGLDSASEGQLLLLAKSIEDGPVLAGAARWLGQRPKLDSAAFLLDKTASPEPAVRAAAIDALGELKVKEAAKPVQMHLKDKDAGVRRAAATAAGLLHLSAARASLAKLAGDSNADVRRASLDALRLMKDARALTSAVAALADPATQLAALRYIADLGGPKQAKALIDLARQNPAPEILDIVLRAFSHWNGSPDSTLDLSRACADLQGTSGVLARWQTAGPLPAKTDLIERFASVPAKTEPVDATWRLEFGTGLESRLRLNAAKGADAGAMWLAYTDIGASERAEVQFLAGSNAGVRVWLNGKLVHERAAAQSFRVDGERFDAVLEKGLNRVLLHFPGPKADVEFHLRFRRKGVTVAHEKLTQAALSRAGNAERGRRLFFNAEKTQCIKCHRIGEQGERIGPELTGIGDRFARIYLIESILEPSRTIANGYQTLVVALKDGRQIIGVKVAETEKRAITLGDQQGKKHEIAKSDIEEQRTQSLSVMPEGLEKPLTLDEFVDLIAFLVSQKDRR